MADHSDEEENDNAANSDTEQTTNVESAAAPTAIVQGEDEDDFAFQLRMEAEERKRAEANVQEQSQENGASTSTGVMATADGRYVYTDPNDGTVYEYDYEKKAWFPRVDDDFIARYQAQYGVYDPQQQSELAQQTSSAQASVQQQPTPSNQKEEPPEGLNEEEKKAWLKQRKKEKRKLAAERQRQQPQWFDIDHDQNTNVYVSGLPPNTELKEFEEIMSKCGVIARDLETRKLKLKLYRDPEGNLKGDGLCCYIKKESVELALDILDGSDVRGHKLKVEPAHFELKGDYDPSKKKKKLSAKQKKKLLEKQEKLFDWRPEKMKGERPRSDSTVIVKRLFTLDEMPERYTSLMESLREHCSKYGEVRKVVIYDNNPDGVASVMFKDPESADDCIQMMDWRHFEGKQLRAERWDGKTKYKVEESEEDRKKRLAKWQAYVESGGSAPESAELS